MSFFLSILVTIDFHYMLKSSVNILLNVSFCVLHKVIWLRNNVHPFNASFQPKYKCICDAGRTSPPGVSACTADIDECSLPNKPCSTNPIVQCFNTLGSFYCGACPAGQTTQPSWATSDMIIVMMSILSITYVFFLFFCFLDRMHLHLKAFGRLADIYQEHLFMKLIFVSSRMAG